MPALTGDLHYQRPRLALKVFHPGHGWPTHWHRGTIQVLVVRLTKASSGWILVVKLWNLFEQQIIIYQNLSGYIPLQQPLIRIWQWLILDMCWYFNTYMSKPPLKQTSGSNNLNSATSVEDWCWGHTRVWSSSRERSSLLPSRCNNTNFSACFDWDLEVQLWQQNYSNCDTLLLWTIDLFRTLICFHFPTLFVGDTLNRQWTSLTFNWETHLQKKMVRKRSQPNTYSRTTSTDSAFALEDIHFTGSPLSRWRAISGALLVGWFVMVWGLKMIAGQGQRRDKRDGDII